jgi:hypothetical protein
VDKAAQKVVDHYVPPIAVVETDFNFDQAITVIHYEVTANIGDIEPQARIYYQLNCSEQMIRRLSLHFKVNGKEGFDEKPSEWEYASPETHSSNVTPRTIGAAPA